MKKRAVSGNMGYVGSVINTFLYDKVYGILTMLSAMKPRNKFDAIAGNYIHTHTS